MGSRDTSNSELSIPVGRMGPWIRHGTMLFVMIGTIYTGALYFVEPRAQIFIEAQMAQQGYARKEQTTRIEQRVERNSLKADKIERDISGMKATQQQMLDLMREQRAISRELLRKSN